MLELAKQMGLKHVLFGFILDLLAKGPFSWWCPASARNHTAGASKRFDKGLSNENRISNPQ